MTMTRRLVRPKRVTDGELAKVGVRIIDRDSVLLECVRRGHRWTPKLMAGGRMPTGWWRCPNGCNEAKEKET